MNNTEMHRTEKLEAFTDSKQLATFANVWGGNMVLILHV